MSAKTKRTSAIAAALALAALWAIPAEAEFGLNEVSLKAVNQDGSPAVGAGAHPFSLNTTFAVNTKESDGLEVPDEEARDITARLPPGLLVDPGAVEACSAADFAGGEPSGTPACPDASVIGIFDLTFGFGEPGDIHIPVYNLAPPPGAVVRFGFRPLGVPVAVDGGISPTPPYNGYANSLNIAQGGFFYRGSLRIWGNPASPLHDAERGGCGESENPDDLCPVGIEELPFVYAPRSCTGTLRSLIRARSWLDPDRWLSYEPTAPGMQECSKLGFTPTIEAKLSTDRAEAPSGFAFDLDFADPGLANPDGRTASDVKKVVTLFPEGVTANPSQAGGLLACSEARLAGETATSGPGEGCPEAAKIGSVEAETPLLKGTVLKGSLYVATPFKNPFGTLIALYMTVKDPARGVNVIAKGKVEPDPLTGRLIATFDDLPQTPISHVRLRLREGGRSPLVSPPRCGTYEVEALLTPWSDPGRTVTESSTFEISSGPGGGPCPGAQPFEPGFAAGSVASAAGRHSPFQMRLTRRDGDQDLTRFDATLPPGVSATLAGVERCPEARIALAKSKSGKAELASPSCPLNSRIGSIQAGAGVGDQLIYVPGTLYLAGPFAGAPASVVGVVPAVAGPFDVGTVVVRQALRVDPRSGRASADGGSSDPIPHILAGIPLRVRDIQVSVDRSGFTFNPTGCDPAATLAQIWGGGANPLAGIDDAPVARSARYQASSCQSLAFKPRMSLRLRGGTRRGEFPALRLTYRPGPGNANVQSLALRFPSSEFIEQGHFRTICTRVQFAAGAGHGAECPKGAIYGSATVRTPVLSEPLRGPVFLRSSDNNLPDVVLALHGPPSVPVEIEVPARIDSVRGGLRAILSDSPDLPVTAAVVSMQGGAKGLFVNSTNICAKPHRATVRLIAHNAERRTLRPPLRPRCGGAERGARRGG